MVDDLVETRERELKFDVSPEWSLPTIGSLDPDNCVLAPVTVRLVTTYYDTASRDLLAAGVTLRRRTGDADQGWHLKVPDGDARIEVRAELNGGGVPQSLRDLVVGVRAGDPLKTMATLVTQRTVYRLIDADGRALADIADDQVSAVVYEPRRRHVTWREIEVELTGGDESLLERSRRELLDSGAVRSASSSKLAHALYRPRGVVEPDLSLAGLIRGYVADQVDVLMRHDIDLRRDQDVIHPTRVAIRRLRSALRVFGDVFERGRATHLNEELSWFAGLLGAVRDHEVLRLRLLSALSEMPAAAIIGPVQARIDQMLGAERNRAQIALSKAMSRPRYLALMRELKLWRDEPAFVDEIAASDSVADRLEMASVKARKRLRTAARHADVDEAMHGARKAAKRARYAAELTEPKLGKKARTAIREFKRVQDGLGSAQDGVVAAEFLLRAAAEAQAAPGESPFTFGALWAREQENARAARRKLLT